ncbi:MAG: galactose-1-phosphate uridylyltransferase [bacterium]
MPELRRDPIINRWVIIATERGKRPSDFGTAEGRRKREEFCPFCGGNEDKTPPEILAYREAGTPANGAGWWVRTVPNDSPALQVEGDLNRQGDGMYDKMNGVGAHEVIIETPSHDTDIGSMPVKQVEEVLWMYRDRIMDLKRDPRLKYTLIFRNRGEAAGASFEHPHSQLIATPIVPKRVMEEMEGSKQYYDYKERCIFCDIIHQEIGSMERTVEENADFISIEPFASRFPFETWILPKKHESNFETIKKHEIMNLARCLRNTLSRINGALDNPPYNYIIHTTPCDQSGLTYYHWHFEIMPKLTKVAGFEWGSGFHINPTPPEEATKYLREVEVEEN